MKPETTRRVRRVLWTVSIAVIAVSAVAIVAAIRQGDPSTATASTGLHVATELPEPLPRPRQSAPDTAGNPVALVQPAAGKLSLVYFGYTNCPDVCPLDMAALAAGLRELTPAQRARVRVVFATVDPERDTAATLKPWLAHHDPAFIGVIPPLSQTNATLERLGYAPVTREAMPDGKGYAVSHPAGVYVYTDDGLAHVAFFGVNPPADIAHDLGALLGGWNASKLSAVSNSPESGALS